jgi:hypothetical protein
MKVGTASPKAAARGGKGTKNPKKATKLSRLEALLRRPEGATIAQLVSELDWQPHSVRGAIFGSLKKKRGLKIDDEKAEGKERIYRIVP